MTNRQPTLRTLQLLLLSSVLVLLAASKTDAGGPVVWETDSRAELLSGEAHGVSVTDTGALMLAPQFTQVFNTEQAYVWSSTADAAGNVYLGTGHDGKIFRVGADGKGSLLYDAAELDVTALVVGRDGALYAGTSPDGKVYRITQDGKAELYFDPPDKYIWSLAVMSDGSLAVGTGDTGKLYRVRAAGAKPADSLLIDTNETHIISLAVDPKGNLIAGTDPGGLVLRVSPEGKAFALFDSPLREIHALALAPDGSIYALALSDAATSTRQSSTTQATQSVSTTSAGGTVTGTVTSVDEGGAQTMTIGAQPQAQARSRNDLQNVRSAVFRIMPDGGSDVLWSSPTVTAFSAGAQVASPRARFIQWRAVLHSTPQGDARVEDVSLAYLPRNVAPEVTQIQVLPVGIALQSAVQVPVDPNIETSGLDPSLIGPQVQIPPRRLFQRGAISLQWQAEDRNGDQLEYSVYYRSVSENTFHLLKEGLRENFYSTDGAALGDGRYVFKVVASDAPENSLGKALTGARVSETVDVDSTPPVVRVAGEPQTSADGRVRVRFTVDDTSGTIRRADVSVDGGDWRAVFPEDGIADSPHETYALELLLASAGEHTISLRAVDGSGNVSSARVVVRR